MRKGSVPTAPTAPTIPASEGDPVIASTSSGIAVPLIWERVRLDPSPERHRDELAALSGVTIASDGGDRARYRSLLASAHFAVAPYRAGCPWSMSVIDCQGIGLPVIAPRTGWLAEHIDEDLLFDTPDEAVRIALRLAEDAEFYVLHAKRAHASTAEFAPSAVAARYLEAIAEVVDGEDLARTRRWIEAEKQREDERQRGIEAQPPAPDWLIEQGLNGSAAVYLPRRRLPHGRQAQ
jgi:hypothetical protein